MGKTTKKVLFLDFDGPISTSRAQFSNNWCVEDDSFINHGKDKSLELWQENWLDETPCRLVNRLCCEFDLRIVISSTWRKLFHQQVLAAWLYKKGGIEPHRVIGITPDFGHRGAEIKKWLSENDGYEIYLVLDDDTGDIKPYISKVNFQHVMNFETGFSLKEYDAARNKLLQQISDYDKMDR